MNPALRFPIPEKRPMVLPRVPHKQMKQARLSINAAAMRSPIPRGDVAVTDRLKIAQKLLVLQQRGLLRVWVDGDVVRVAHYNATHDNRRELRWQDAREIVDNPDKNLAKHLRGMA